MNKWIFNESSNQNYNNDQAQIIILDYVLIKNIFVLLD